MAKTLSNKLITLITLEHKACMQQLPPDQTEFGPLADIPIRSFIDLFTVIFNTPEWADTSEKQKEKSVAVIMTHVFMETQVNHDAFGGHRYKPFYKWKGYIQDNVDVTYTYWFEK